MAVPLRGGEGVVKGLPLIKDDFKYFFFNEKKVPTAIKLEGGGGVGGPLWPRL